MKRKYYSKRQRILYGLGYFAISVVVGFFFQSLNWMILSFFAYCFGALSLYTGFFSTNNLNLVKPGEFTSEDFDDPEDYAEYIYRFLKDTKKDLQLIQKQNQGKLTKKNFISYINNLKKNHTIKFNKILLKNKDVFDDKLIAKPWKKTTK